MSFGAVNGVGTSSSLVARSRSVVTVSGSSESRSDSSFHNRFATLTNWRSAAQTIAVRPRASLAVGSAPAARNMSIASVWLSPAANISGVSPNGPAMFGSAPASINGGIDARSIRPFQTAALSGLYDRLAAAPADRR